MDDDLPQRLAVRLREPLPGRAAQSRFEPELSFGRHFGPPTHRARPAAVMILLYERAGQWHVPLTARPATMNTHAGQISLPGGSVESDESSELAALRELEEELGVDRAAVTMLGRLSPLYVFVTDFMLIPWIGVAADPPTFRPDAREVAELLEVPLAHLADPKNHATHNRRNRGVAVRAPHMAWGRHRVWGATSMILGELIELVGRRP